MQSIATKQSFLRDERAEEVEFKRFKIKFKMWYLPINFQIQSNVATSSISFLLFLMTQVQIASATYSIVSTDATTRQVGGAGATCLPDRDIYEVLYHSVPNRTVLHTQGRLLDRNDTIILKAMDMMQQNENESVNDILSAMLASDSYTFSLQSGETYFGRQLRQYGIADFDSHNAHTGSKLTELWEKIPPLYYDGMIVEGNEETDQGGKFGDDRYIFHAMGNVVKTGTVKSMSNGIQSLNNDDYDYGVCDMAGKLMAALQSVSDGGYGDVRCTDDDEKGYSASGAFLHIDNPDGMELIHINVIGDGKEEPVEVVKNAFREWRKDHPCKDSSRASTSAAGWPVLMSAIGGLLSILITSSL